MKGRLASLAETIVTLAILLVLLQTLFEDLAVALSWPWAVRRSLALAGFGFDLFFSLEFLIRFFTALTRRRALTYLRREYGWIDFLASIPLVLLSSGPVFLSIFFVNVSVTGIGGSVNVLKVVKALRIARLLRLLRVLKIFRSIRFVDSPMAQRHITRVTALGITTLVLGSFLLNLGVSSLPFKTLEGRVQEQAAQGAATLASLSAGLDPALLRELFEREPNLLVVNRAGSLLYSRFDDPYYRANFGPGDYSWTQAQDYEFFFDLRPVNEDQALGGLLTFILAVFLVAVYGTGYAGHFALTVTDPLNVMLRGLEDQSYHLQAKGHPAFSQDEVFRLADAYNREYLPLKERLRSTGEAQASALKLGDVQGLLK